MVVRREGMRRCRGARGARVGWDGVVDGLGLGGW